MIEFITPHTLANTIKMGAGSKRPKAVFLANDAADAKLAQSVMTQKECRVIQAHSRQNAVEAFRLLVESGWEGVLTTVNTHFAPPDTQYVAEAMAGPAQDSVVIEGQWDEIRQYSGRLSGKKVHVAVVGDPPVGGDAALVATPNRSMLAALAKAKELTQGIQPRRTGKDYLREAREGAMYGFGGDS